MSDTKHGWVTPRADGARARCGGPGVCATCNTEAMHEAMLTGVFGAPASASVAPGDAQREAVMDAIAGALGDAYDCMRVWAAWGVGTMSQDDFRLVADDAGRLGELADAAIAAMTPAPAAGDARDGKRLEWIAQNAWALRDIENGRKNALVWQQPRVATEGALDRLRSAIDAALAAQVPQQGEA